MGWVSNDNEHEGWAAAVAPDGRLVRLIHERRNAR